MSEIVCSVWTEGRFVWKQCWVLKYSSSCGRGNCHTRNILSARQECEDSSRPSGTPSPGRNHSPGSGSNMCHSRWLLACEQPLLFGRAPRERASEGQSREGPPTPLPRVRVFLSRDSRTSTFNDIPKRRASSLATILVKTFGTLCVLGEENVLQVDPPPPWTVLGVKSQTPFNLHILYTLWTSTLFRGGWGKNLVEAVFMSVYRRVAVNSMQNQLKMGRCPKPFWPGL